MTVLRTSKSSFDKHLAVFTKVGHASEIADPERTAMRIEIEDLIIVVRDKVITPNFNSSSFSRINIEAIIRDGATIHKETENLPLEKAASNILKLPSKKEFRICWKNNKYSYWGLPVYDQGTRGLDFIKIMTIELNENINKIKFLDRRIMGGKNSLNRDIYALKLNKNFKRTGKISTSWSWNKKKNKCEYSAPHKKIEFPRTPILKTIIKELATGM